MSRTVTIDSVDRTAVIRLESLVTVESAYGGEVGVSGFDLDDEALGDVAAMKDITVIESAATPTRMFTGFIAGRSLGRGVLGKVANRRQWDVEIIDLNACLDDEVFTTSTANRPAETDFARMTWLLDTPAVLQSLGVTAGVLPNTNTVTMDAFNYKGSTPRRVANDCAEAAGKNYFLYDFGAGPKLYYDKQTGTSLSSGARLTTVAADVDNSVTWAIEEPLLRMDPTRIYSTVVFQYEGGRVDVTDAGTESSYRRREIYVEDRNVKTAALATTKATAYLDAAGSEEETLSCAVTLPAANVNDIRAGMRIELKVAHLGISAYTYYRITRRTVTGASGRQGVSDVLYRVALEFAPEIKMTSFSGGGGGSGSIGGGGGPGSGSGSPWVQFLDESGDSLTGWVEHSGDWAVVSDAIQGDNGVDTNAILYFDSRDPIAGVVIEAEMKFVGVGFFGLLTDFNPDDSEGSFGHVVYLKGFSTNVHMLDVPDEQNGLNELNMNSDISLPLVDEDTYYKLRVMRVGLWMNVWVDGVLYATFTAGEPFGVDRYVDYAPTGAVDGVNTTYTIATAFKRGTTAVYLNGMKLRRGVDYNETDTATIELTDPPLTGDTLWLEWRGISGRALDYVGLWVRAGEAHFRNIRAWRLALP